MGEKSLEEKKYTVEEYFELLSNSEEKLDYEKGRVFSMAGGKYPHGRAIRNTLIALEKALEGKDCVTYTSDMGIYIEEYGRYTYPDLSVVCGEADFEREMFFKNPRIIVEVASKSTENDDNTTKLLKYFSLPSLLEYMLIQTERPIVMLHSRNEKGAFETSGTMGINSKIYIPNFDVHLSMKEIYKGVTGLKEPDLN